MKYLIYSAFFCVLTIFWSCSQTSEYKRMEARELASGERHDSLFLGIYLGMSSKDFYAHCWEMNKKELIKEGMNNSSVQYIPKELKHPGKMYFYPKVWEDKIYEMPISFVYDAWAPWNKELFADSLQVDVRRMFEVWYGEGFMEISHPQRGPAFVKMDGNRRITIWKEDDQRVRASITDVPTEKIVEAQLAEMEKEREKESGGEK
ncbi:MAG: hypothetical protein SH848_12335 [Saprospiraceae bacterium]|nr:hypothetical protein [Saprospiraceae bacterium]MDZ4704713.1 hypothetical protein [Saprospiraceae bacterium]